MGPHAKGTTYRLLAALVASGFPLGVAAPARAATEPPASDVLDRLERPQLLNSATVTYPPALAADPETAPRGQVVVKYTIGTDGVPKQAVVEQGLHPELDALALAAVSELRYQPARLDGVPVEVVNRIAIAFEPPAPEEAPPEPEPEDEPADATPAGGSDAEPAPAAEPTDEPEPTDAPSTPDPDAPLRLEGQVLEAGLRTPLARATIVVVPADPNASTGAVRKKDYREAEAPAWQATGQSDENGRFTIRGIPDGKAKVIVLLPGFERQEYVEQLDPGEVLGVKYFVQRSPTNPYRTVVRIENAREEVARRSISVEEINALPGTQGDALKSIQNFPGIARSPFGIGLLAIRGTGPNDSAVYLGYHEIPQLFHFGGLTSVFNSDILARIDFIPGNFDSRYGDAIGGIVSVEPRAGRRDGYHGYIDSDVFDTGILFEGKLGKGSFALSGRRSYIDAILPLAIPDDAGLNLTVAPRYYDYQVLFDYPVGGGNLSIRGFGSDDRTTLVAANPNEIETDQRDQFETISYFHRADIVYTKRLGRWDFLVTPSYRHEYLRLGISNALSLGLTTNNLTGRAEVGYRLTQRTKLTVGAEYRSFWFDIDVSSPAPTAGGTGSTDERLRTRVSGFAADPALYTTLELGLGKRLTLYPGVRVTYYSALDDIVTFDPRLRFGLQVAEKTTLKGGIGIYSQAPQPIEYSDVYGNPRIGPERALQNSLGVAQALPFGITIDATVFFNYLFANVAPSFQTELRNGIPVPENYSNTQTGRVYGAEILLRKELTSNFFGWVAYTVSRSERRNAPGEDWVLFDFDQTHILTLLGVYRLPRGWQVGARFRIVSGNPDTPIVGGVLDASTGGYTPIRGRLNSDRVPLFHQLDLRVDKKWTWRRVSLTTYLDILNVYNAQNVEFWNYSFNYRKRQEIASLPIIPSLGVKLEF